MGRGGEAAARSGERDGDARTGARGLSIGHGLSPSSVISVRPNGANQSPNSASAELLTRSSEARWDEAETQR